MELEHINQQYTFLRKLITRKDEYICKCLHFFRVDITFFRKLTCQVSIRRGSGFVFQVFSKYLFHFEVFVHKLTLLEPEPKLSVKLLT